mgnify:CR=1 FL=1
MLVLNNHNRPTKKKLKVEDMAPKTATLYQFRQELTKTLKLIFGTQEFSIRDAKRVMRTVYHGKSLSYGVTDQVASLHHAYVNFCDSGNWPGYTNNDWKIWEYDRMRHHLDSMVKDDSYKLEMIKDLSRPGVYEKVLFKFKR